MKEVKRTLCILLALVMVLSLSPLSALAGEIDPEPVICTEHVYGEDGLCTICGAEKPTDPEPVICTEHVYGEDGLCTVCGAEKPADPEPVICTEHVYGEDGLCTVCGAEKPADPEPVIEYPALDVELPVEDGLTVRVNVPEGALPQGAAVHVRRAEAGLYSDALLALSVSFKQEVDGVLTDVAPLLPFTVYVRSEALADQAKLGVEQIAGDETKALDLLDAAELGEYDLAFLATAAGDFTVISDAEHVLFLADRRIEADASDGAHVSVAGLLPVDGVVTIAPVTLTAEQVLAIFGDAGDAGKTYVVYDISVWVDGVEWEPANEQILSVVVTPPAEALPEAAEVSVSHMDNEGKVTDLGTTGVTEGAVGFETDGFSFYIIVVIDKPADTLTFKGEGFTVKISYTEESEIPVGTELVVEEIGPEDPRFEELLGISHGALNPIDPEDYESDLEFKMDLLFRDTWEVLSASILDIKLIYEGEEIEPNPEHPLQVEVVFDEGLTANENAEPAVIHFADDGVEVITEVDVERNENGDAVKFSYEQDSFSISINMMYQFFSVPTNQGSDYGLPDDGNGSMIVIPGFNTQHILLATWNAWTNNGSSPLTFRYGPYGTGGANVFQLGMYSSNGLVFPGQPGFPTGVAEWLFTSAPSWDPYYYPDICTLEEGTSITEIIAYFNINSKYISDGLGINFLMDTTYTVNSATNAHAKNAVANTWGFDSSSSGVGDAFTLNQFSEIWKSIPSHTVRIQRNDGNGRWHAPLIVSNGPGPLAILGGIVIDNMSAKSDVTVSDGSDDSKTGAIYPIALETTGGSSGAASASGLTMIFDGSYITDSSYNGTPVGTGVKITNLGSLEMFSYGNNYVATAASSYIEKMAVAVEQINGKTRLKTSADPFGSAHNNTIGVALSYGQSIGKWYDSISSISSVPIFLRSVRSWKSGDVVLDSGYQIAPQSGYPDGRKAFVIPEDEQKLNLVNQNDTTTAMDLEYYAGPTGADLPYPVIRFYVGTVLNTRTGVWYKNLYDAVNNNDPIGGDLSGVTMIRDDDTLVFFGNTVEDQDINIPYNLTIRDSVAGECNDVRAGQNYAASMYYDYIAPGQTVSTPIGTGITVASGKTVTFGGNGTTLSTGQTSTISGTPGNLTINGGSISSTLITNNGTVNWKTNATVANAAGYGIYQNGVFYEAGGDFSNNATADVYLCSTATAANSITSEDDTANHVIWLDVNPSNTSPVTVELGSAVGNLYDLRNVVVSHSGTVTQNDLTKYDLIAATDTALAGKHLSYVYTSSDDAWNCAVLELYEEEYFQVFHSSNNSTEKIYKSDSRVTWSGGSTGGGNPSFAITGEVASGYLYGGYYKAYNKMGTNYAGGPGNWLWVNAYTATADATTGEGGTGTAMRPIFDKAAPHTYYLKEVPSSYLMPYMHIVYWIGTGEIVKVYLMTGVDDLNFRNVSISMYDTTSSTWKGLATAFKVYESVNTSNYTSLTCQSVFGSTGFLAIWDHPVNASPSFTYRAQYDTPDGVTVHGLASRAVTVGDGNFYPTYDFSQAAGNTGIYRIDTASNNWAA